MNLTLNYAHFQAGDLVNPLPKSHFAQRLLDKKESVYASKRTAPLGSCHDQSPGLPKEVGPYDVQYGVKTIKGIINFQFINQNYTWINTYIKLLISTLNLWLSININTDL